TAKWSYGCDVYARVPGKLAGVRSLIYVSPQERKDGIIIPLARTKSLKGKIDVKEVVAMDKVRVKVLSWWLNIHEGRFFGARRNKDDREPWPQLVEFSPDAQGEVTIPDVPVGTFINIAARCPGIPDVELSQFLVKQRDEKFSLALHPQDTTRRYGTLKGTVRNKEGKGVGGVDIGCVGRTQEPDPSSQVYYGKADSDGHYQIPDVLAGTYEVQLYPPGGTVYLPVQGVKVVPGGISKADLLIEPGTELTGQILDKKTGKGVSRACLAFYADSDPKGAQPYTALPYATARVDENGAFKIKLPGGKSKFYLIESPFYKNQYQSTSIEVVNGKALKPLICELEPETPGSGFFSIQGQPATIKGRVLDPAGNPLPDIEVYEGIVSSREIERLRLGVGRVITAADGTYTLKTYWKGECCVTVRDATTSQTQSKVFTVAEGGEYQVEDLTVRMATASISGKVVDTAGKPVANSEVRAFSESKGFESFVVQTDKDGVFRLSPVVDDEQFKLQIYAPGPRFAEGKIKPDLKNAVFVVRKAVRK
ncbi:MAG: carboxypeptidase regulatory-like domain-containing protein, partial [Candidatus Methylacidiphilales bacterium]